MASSLTRARRWDGKLERGPYLLLGVGLLLLKHLLDYLVATHFFGRDWQPLNYGSESRNSPVR